MIYKYIGLDQAGENVAGEISAKNKKSAESNLLNSGILIKKIRVKFGLNFKFFLNNFFNKLLDKKIKKLEIYGFLNALSWLLSSGLVLVKALNLLEAQQENLKNKNIKNLIKNIKNKIEAGESLAQGLLNYPQYFDLEIIEWVSAGENSGALDQVLLKIVSWQESKKKRKEKIKKALTYPALILIVITGVLFLMMAFVIPSFEKMFASFNAPLPGLTQMVIEFSHGFLNYFWMGFVLIFLIGFALFLSFKFFKKLSYLRDKFFVFMPGLGFLIRRSYDSKILSLMGIALSSGVNLLKALKSAECVTGNLYLKNILKQAELKIWEGWSLSQALGESRYFLKSDLDLLALSENAGNLDQMLLRVSEQAGVIFNQKVDQLLLLLEPILMLVMGVLVGFFVIAMYLPIFQLGAVV